MRAPDSPYSHQHLVFSVYLFFLTKAILVGEKNGSSLWFDTHFLNDQWCGTFFCVLIMYLYMFFEKMYVQVFCPFYNCFLLLLSFKSCFYFLSIKPLPDFNLQIFSPVSCFHILHNVLWYRKVHFIFFLLLLTLLVYEFVAKCEVMTIYPYVFSK